MKIETKKNKKNIPIDYFDRLVVKIKTNLIINQHWGNTFDLSTNLTRNNVSIPKILNDYVDN